MAAKKGLLQRIGTWLRGGSSKKTTAPKPRMNRDARNETVSTRTYTSPRRALLDLTKGNDKEERRIKSMAEATKDSGVKKEPPKPKLEGNEAQKKAREEYFAQEERIKKAHEEEKARRNKEREEFNKATNDRYNVKGAKDKAERLKRRQAQKSQAFDADVAMHSFEAHPIATSAARGAASGVSFGLTDLLASKGTKGEAKKVEEYYQANKNKTAETVGELAGSLAAFGLTAGATDALGEKAIEKLAPNLTKNLAKSEAVEGLAKRGVDKAVKRGLVRKELASEAGGELIKNVGLKKADQIAKALGTDIMQNLTTGAIYDINKASAEYEVGSADWWKELGKSAALNFAITGAIGGVSALKGGKRLAAEEASNLVNSRTKRLQGQILGKATAAELALDRAPMAKGAYGNIREGILPPSEIDMSGLRDLPEWKTPLQIQRGERQAFIDKALANAPEDSRKFRLEELINIPTKTDVRISAINKELDDIYAEINRVQRYAPQEELDALYRRFDELMSERSALESGERRLPEFDPIRDKARRSGTPENARNLVFGTAEQSDAALDRAIVNEGAYGNIREGVLPPSEIEIGEGLPNIRPTYLSNAERVESLENTLGRVLDNAGANRAIENEKGVLGNLIGVQSQTEKRLAEVNQELDALYENITRNRNLIPEEELDSLVHRFDELLAERNSLEESVRASRAKADALGTYKNNRLKENPDAVFDETKTAKSRKKGARKKAETPAPKESAVAEDIPFTTDDGRPIIGEPSIEPSEPIPQPTQAKGTRKAAENLKPKDATWDGGYASVGDEIPVENHNQTVLNDTKAEAQARAKRVMEEPPKEEPKGTTKKAGKAAEEASEREFTQGQKDARQAFYEKTGTNPETGKAATDDQILEGMGRYHRSQGTSAERKLSRVAMSQIGVSSEEAAERLLKMQDEGAFEYGVIHHKEMYKEVADDLANDPDRWIDKLCDVVENDEWSGKESPKLLYMAQYLAEVTDAAKSPEQDALATMAYKAMQKLSTTSAQTLNGRRAYAHLSKAGKMECALDDMVSVLDSAIGFNKQHRQAMQGLDKYARQDYIKGQLLKDEKLKECLKKLANAKTEDDISEAYTEMFLQFNKSNPKSGFDVVQELRYLGMLGNPKTHIRNMFGSGFFAPMRQISNALRSVMEDRIAKEAGLEITKHGGMSLSAAAEAWAKNPTTEAGKAALDAFESRKKDILGSMKYDTPQYAGRAKTAAGKLLDKVSDFNSNLLAKEDDFFKSRAFKENYIKSYNKYLKDGVPITDKIKKQIEEEAIQEAQIATFNEYNEFAKWLSSITRKANDANASPLARWGGRAVNAVMPFTKVPANLMKQSVNYSPLGIAKGMMNIKSAAKKGDAVLLNRAIDELASGLTGTGIFGLGMLLGKTTDMFTTNTGKNDPAAKFKKDRGMQNYSITFKDPETGQGHSFTLDWLVPTSATFFSGVEMANQLKSGDFNILDIGNDWSTVMTRLAEPVMETSMLSGLHGMLETMRSGSDSDDSKSAIQVLLRETAQSYMSSLIPTIVGQAARTAYKSDMQITGDDDWQYFWNSTKSKAGLANTNILGEALGADTDAYGNIKNEKTSGADYLKAGLKNFLSPANIQKVDFSEVDNEKLRVYEEAVKNGADPNDMAYLFPKKQYKKQFSVAGEDVKMSNKDLSAYNQAKTTGGEEGMRYVLENIMFNRYDYDSKGKKVPRAGAYTAAQKKALMEQFKGKSMREVEQWLYAQPEFKSASQAEQKKAIEGLWKLTKDSKTTGSQRVGEQAVYKAQGKDVNEYNYKNEITESKREALQAAIDSGLITYEEAVDFARNGGKVSYSEDEDGGGSATTYYTKAAMIEYFVEHGIPYDKAEALYNAFKSKNTKPYSGNGKTSSKSGSGSGYRSGGRRRSGGKSKKVKAPAAKSMAAATKKAKGTSVKLEPPAPKTYKVTTKFKDYEI